MGLGLRFQYKVCWSGGATPAAVVQNMNVNLSLGVLECKAHTPETPKTRRLPKLEVSDAHPATAQQHIKMSGP